MFKRTLWAGVTAGLVSLAVAAPAHAVVATPPTNLAPQFNGVVHAVAHRGNIVYVGGDFTRVTGTNGRFVRKHAAAFNVNTGRVLKRWNPKVDGVVEDIAARTDGVFLGGTFRTVKNERHRNIVKVHAKGRGRPIVGFQVRTNGPVNTVLVAGKRVYIGGAFTKVNGEPRGQVAAFARKGSFALNKKWRPSAATGAVMDLERGPLGIYVAGAFKTINGSDAQQRLALVTRVTGRTVAGFDSLLHRDVLAVDAVGTRVYAAEAGVMGGGVHALDAATGRRLWERRLDGDAQAILVMKSRVYVGGHFDRICDRGATQLMNGTCDNRAASVLSSRGAAFDLDGNVDGAWRPNANTAVGFMALDAFPSRELLLVGGGFTRAGNVNRLNFAAFTG